MMIMFINVFFKLPFVSLFIGTYYLHTYFSSGLDKHPELKLLEHSIVFTLLSLQVWVKHPKRKRQTICIIFNSERATKANNENFHPQKLKK